MDELEYKLELLENAIKVIKSKIDPMKKEYETIVLIEKYVDILRAELFPAGVNS